MTASHLVPANSLANWEHSLRANQWMKQLAKENSFDLVWRMHPYHGACPLEPSTMGKPLVIGPLFYGWPETNAPVVITGKPRLGFGLQNLVSPAANQGWHRTLNSASLVFCATMPHAGALSRELRNTIVRELPVMVSPGSATVHRVQRYRRDGAKLVFVSNLVGYKRPMIFCETIKRLLDNKTPVSGIVIGDGPERGRLERYVADEELPIQLIGKVPNHSVYNYLKDADFLVSTSIGEPYGRGIAEAMSVGTPAVCHRSGGPADYITDGYDGLLVDELSADEYALRLEHVFSLQNAWNRLSDNALATASSWLPDAVLDKLEDQLIQTAMRSTERSLAA
jgi:glycosyltransferase involved in cell wall biosynthesis